MLQRISLVAIAWGPSIASSYRCMLTANIFKNRPRKQNPETSKSFMMLTVPLNIYSERTWI
jgi:hypothetical protein